MSNAKILDLDQLVPDKKIVKLAGEEIDVSIIPTRVVLEMEKKKTLLMSGKDESFPMLLNMIVKVMRISKPEITEDWLIDNTNMNQLIALITFIMEDLEEKANEGQPKNATAPKAVK